MTTAPATIPHAATLRGSRRFAHYTDFAPTEIPFVAQLPRHWRTEKLKHVASVRFSSVDKKTEEGQVAVRLCNYTDVYNRDVITDDPDFMQATATQAEIQRFTLRQGDVLVTKDSEAWNDIAVPAFVPHDFNGVLCGYHLAQVRPDPTQLDGAFLARAFSADGVRQQFHIAANGITRFGLPNRAIAGALFPIPPLDEQRAIAAYLDREMSRIDDLIAQKRRLIHFLREKRAAYINRVVTKGLDQTVAMRASGVEWLGQLPAHWSVKRLRFLFDNLNHRRIPLSAEDRSYRAKIFPYYGASGIIDAVDEFIFDEPLILVAEDGANLLSRSTPLAFIAEGKYWVNNHAHIIRPRQGPIRYWEAVLQSFDFTPLVSGSAQPKLTIGNLNNVPLPVPPLSEQEEIAITLEREDRRLAGVIGAICSAVDRLKDLRMSLISSAVTGTINVCDGRKEASCP